MTRQRLLYCVLGLPGVVVVLLSSFMAYNYWFAFNPRCNSALKTKKECGVIVDALWRYREENKSLPPNLETLVPGYLPLLPKVTYGDPNWFYHQAQGDFTVGFTATGGYPGCYYSSRIRDWYIDE